MRGTYIPIILLVAAVILPGLALAEFDAELVTIQESILPGESALFEVLITNALETADSYTIAPGESTYIVFLDPNPSEVLPGETATYGVEISPRSSVNIGTHKVPLRVRSSVTGEITTLSPFVNIRDPNVVPGQYTPSIALTVHNPARVDPREDLLLNIHLRNRNARNYDSSDLLTVRIESDIFEKEYTTQLGPVGQDGEKTTEIRMQLDPYQSPGEHPLRVTLSVDGATISSQESNFEVVSFAEAEKAEFSDSSLFKTTTSYKLRNDGNVPETAIIIYPVNPFKRPFMSSSENYEIRDVEGTSSIVIERDLEPLEETTVTITENYRLLVLLLIIIILSIIGYFLLRSPVVLGKEASLAGTPKEGISQIKVRLFVKNRSSKTMRNLRVIDRISGMADVQKQAGLGTVKPTKIVKKKGRGTLIRWDLDQLEPFEERIISYKVKTPLKLIGDVTLPNMKVKYDLPNGRERTSHSNEVTIARRE